MEITATIETQKIEFGSPDVLAGKESVHIGYGTDENFVMPMGRFHDFCFGKQ